MEKKHKYPSKIMLVGEYGVIMGGSALTIPFHKFYAQIRSSKDVPPGKEKEAAQSLEYLAELYKYISQLPASRFFAPPNLNYFSTHLKSFWLEMTIPIGYGLGSSGAVSAAIYDRFFPQSGSLSFQQQKEDLACIESFFHGKSSGVDALTCHSGTALHFQNTTSIQRVEFDPAQIQGGYRFFLLNSGVRFDTGPLVKQFLKKLEDKSFAAFMKNEYLPLNQKLIEVLLGDRDADPGLLIRVLSDYQFMHFREMIPEKMLDLWIEGQVSNEFYLKLNGSGGGFMLGITHQTSMDSLESRWKDELIWIG